MTDKFCYMLMRIHMYWNGCYGKVRKAILDMRVLDSAATVHISLTLRFNDRQVLLHADANPYGLQWLLRKSKESNSRYARVGDSFDREEECRVSVCGRFIPQDVAIKIRKKTNLRVEILEIHELMDNSNTATNDQENLQHQAPHAPLISSWNNVISDPNQVETFCIESHH